VSHAVDVLLEHRSRFFSFVRARVREPGAAEDILQAAYVRALDKKDDSSAADERVVAWFYRVLRNAITDYHRRQNAAQRGLERLVHDPTASATPEEPRTPCGCVRGALASLKPAYADILREVEVAGRPLHDVARAIGISAGNAAVRLHRARRLLAAALKGICGSCTLDGCAECDCGHRHSNAEAR
jgi:RNA polymerase sigma factor (sigma-70 family)